MKSIWILGAGRFGLKAAKNYSQKNENAELTIVEENRKICHQVEKLGFKTVCMDGIEYLLQNLKNMDHPDWIIPAIPVHVAYEWVRLKIKGSYILKTTRLPLEVKTRLPNVSEGKRGEIYMSIADFICPDHCPEPNDICTHTGKPRPFTLYKRLESIQDDHFRSVVVQSRQLFPGVGGYTPKALFQTLDIIKSSRISVLLSTACRCHGVMHAFKLKKE
ncbi:MAG: potassium transporter [Desulfobacterales bacterium]|nr:NAD-binding protein [Deltaproteobacteria bacterium]NNL41663.1 potassium transporter [Desulfobacterales bacterium]